VAPLYQDMVLRRKENNVILSDKVQFFGGWKPDYPDPALKTVNNVTYLQRRGRMEWVCPVTFMFCDSFPNSTVSKMYATIRAARNRVWMTFTDRFGDTYDVRIKNVPVPERAPNSPYVPVLYLDCDLLMRGFE
jgi:hypothetical protein